MYMYIPLSLLLLYLQGLVCSTGVNPDSVSDGERCTGDPAVTVSTGIRHLLLVTLGNLQTP